jgi:hypothetical protein
MEKSMVRGDWKSAEQIEEDIEAGEAPDLLRLVLDLWQRVDELQAKLALHRNMITPAKDRMRRTRERRRRGVTPVVVEVSRQEID